MKQSRWIVALGLVLAVIAAANDGCACEVSYPRRERDFPRPSKEVRAIWVTRWDYRTEGDIRTVAENCARVGLNRIYFQVRGRADAFYRSAIEPWGQELGGDPGFDPLAVAIEACRERDIELFAWVNVLPGWKGAKPPNDKRHVVHTHPEWFLTDQNGRRRLVDREHYLLLNPCLPEVRAHLVNVVEEIASRYEIDGIQFDYIRLLSRDANNLLAMIATWQSGDLSANETYHGDYAAALGAITARSIVMPCRTDLYFPPEDSEIEVSHMQAAELRIIPSIWGHYAGGGRDEVDRAFIDAALEELLAA